MITGRGVPDQYRYVFPEDAHMVKAGIYSTWQEKIKEHCQRNGYPFSQERLDIAEDELCKLMPPGVCRYEDGSLPEWFVNQRATLEDVINGTKVLAAWVASGFRLVSRETAIERAKTCAACWANIRIPGCASCSRIMEMVSAVVGIKDALPEDVATHLEAKSCVYCHCLSAANVWVPVEVSRRGVSEEALNAMPAGHCWKRKAAFEMRQSEQEASNKFHDLL
jgi:hypothetical protein